MARPSMRRAIARLGGDEHGMETNTLFDRGRARQHPSRKSHGMDAVRGYEGQSELLIWKEISTEIFEEQRSAFRGDAAETEPPADAEQYMDGFASHQTGKTGDITAGLPPYDYGNVPYVEIYSVENGRIVIELEPTQVEVIGIRPSQPESPIRSRGNSSKTAIWPNSLVVSQLTMNLPAGTRDLRWCRHFSTCGRQTDCQQQDSRHEAADPGDSARNYRHCMARMGRAAKRWRIVKLLHSRLRHGLGTSPRDLPSWRMDRRSTSNSSAWSTVSARSLAMSCSRSLRASMVPMGLAHRKRDLWWKPKTLEEIAPEMFKDKAMEG